MTKEEAAVAAGVLGILIGMILGAAIGASLVRTAAGENNQAHYDTRTGEFRWGPPAEKTP